MKVYAILLGLAPFRCVFLDTHKEFFSGARVAYMFDADVNALLHVPVADLLVEDDTNRRFGHIVDNTGFAMVDFVRLPCALVKDSTTK